MKSSGIRFHEVDYLRGFACLCVVAFHWFSRGPTHGLMPGVEFPLAEAVTRYGYLGVHLFFMISGFVILMSAQGATPRSFAAARAARLYPALWVCATLTAGTAWLLQDAHYMHPFEGYLVNLTMVPHWFGVDYIDGAYWSLGYELHFYILVWLVLRFGLLSRLEWLMAGWLLVSAVNAVRPAWPVEFWLAAKWAPFFTAGGLFYLVRTSGMTRRRLVLLALSFMLAQVYAGEYGRLGDAADGAAAVPRIVVGAVITAIFGVFCLVASGRLRMRASPLAFYAGVLTYPLYLLHENLGFMVYNRLYGMTGVAGAALFLTAVLIVLLSWCVHAWAERRLGPLLMRHLKQPVGKRIQQVA